MARGIRSIKILGMCLVAALLLAGGGLVVLARRQVPAAEPAPDVVSVAELDQLIVRLRPLQTPLGKPRPFDWLAMYHEPEQTFRQYLASEPVQPDRVRRVLYVQPLGAMTLKQREIVDLTAEFMQRYFGLPVTAMPDLSLNEVPAKAQRPSPFGGRQILTGYVLDRVLKPRLPDDAVACIAFTAADLWPGEGWNFVFGQASLRGRVGVWSLARQGDPAAGPDGWRLCLLRTLKVATHETGHMFGMGHCTLWECNMCGSNSLPEADRHPLALCPECLAKLCWCLGVRPEEHLRRVSEFCAAQGLETERQAAAAALKALPAPVPEPAATSRE